MTGGKLTAVGLCSTLVLGSCVSLDQKEARDARTEVPDSYDGAKTKTKTKGEAPAEQQTLASAAAQRRWDQLFEDPALRRLIKEALSNNKELGTRTQEIIIARNEIAARRGEYLPKVNGEAGLGLEKVGKYTSQGAADEANRLPVHLPDLHAGLAASWEIDLWGKLRDAARAASFRYDASLEARHFYVTELVAEIASSYYELVALDAQLDIIRRNLEVMEDALSVVKQKKAAGRATELAVQRFKAEILKNRAHQFELRQERVQVENDLNVVMGRYPRPILRDLERFKAWSPEPLQTGLPSALLDNRPDVKQAAKELEAAKLDVDVARKAFYPSLTIDLRIGYEAFNPLYLLATPASIMYDAAGSLMVPLINRAALTADYRAANARQMQAVLGYEQTLLVAFTEVASQLQRIDNLEQQYAQQSQQVKALRDAVETSGLLYRSARADYMEVLLTRREAIEAEMDLIETRRHQLQAVVGLYQALGGGWRQSPDGAVPGDDGGPVEAAVTDHPWVVRRADASRMAP